MATVAAVVAALGGSPAAAAPAPSQDQAAGTSSEAPPAAERSAPTAAPRAAAAAAAANICNNYCDGRDPALAGADRTAVSTSVWGRSITLHLNDTDAMGWANIANGDPGDQVWIDRSFNNGATWEQLGVTSIPAGGSSWRTLMYNNDNWATAGVGALRACGKAGNRTEIACTEWARTTWNAGNRQTAAATGLMGYYNRSTGQFDTGGWWQTANGLTAMIDNMRITGMGSYRFIIGEIYDRNRGATGDRDTDFRNVYVDDTGWWGLAWLNAYRLTGEQRYLDTAKADAEHMNKSWTPECGGGVLWKSDDPAKKKVAIANSLYIQLNAELHNALPGDTEYLRRAKAGWDWFKQTGMINADNLVNDGVDQSTCGNDGKPVWSYNQGVLISALVELNKATGDASYLDQAKKIADAATTSAVLNVNGILTDKSCTGDCGNDGGVFKGPHVRGLAKLNAALPDRPYTGYLSKQADTAESKDRTPLNLYGLDWNGPPQYVSARTQVAALDLMNAAPFPAKAVTSADRRGSIGWDTLLRPDRIAEIPAGVETKQFSSYDRAGGNNDGFGGDYSCLNGKEASPCVLAEHRGAGEIDSIWFTNFNYAADVAQAGNLRIELDGETVLDKPLIDIVEGRAGAPFVYPLVTNRDQSSGGVSIKVPMTYHSYMRVSTTRRSPFYHVGYRTFASAEGVPTFRVGQLGQDAAMRAAATWGKQDPKPAAPGSTSSTAPITLAPGATAKLFSTNGSGMLDQLRFRLDGLVADGDAARVQATQDVLRKLQVRLTFDGQTTVQAPIGELFSSGWTLAKVASMFHAVAPDAGGATFTSWWPMPYGSAATVELVNTSGQSVSGSLQVSKHDDAAVAGRLRGTDGVPLGYFRAQHQRGDTTAGVDWPLLDAKGAGRLVSISQTMMSKEFGAFRGYLEGDERLLTDGSRSPSWYGTGTEDFYESGWYFNQIADRENDNPRGPNTAGWPFTTPFTGATAMAEQGLTNKVGCEKACDSPYRLLIADSMAFASGMRLSIEHGAQNDVRADYSSTALWYGANLTMQRQTDTLDLGDAASRQAHNYTSAAGAQNFTASYEGDDDTTAVTDQVEYTSSPVSFTAKVDPANTSVTLRRSADQADHYQQATVTVDGQPAGTWMQPRGNTFDRWIDDTFALPLALTAGKSSVRVELKPTGPRWSAAQYEVLSVVPSYADTTAPTAPGGATATGTALNATNLAWTPASDAAGVDHYEVYASTTAGFAPSPATLIGKPATAAFRHENTDVNQTWYYRVRAIDGRGNASGYSAEFTGRTGSSARTEAELGWHSGGNDQTDTFGANWSNHRQMFLTTPGVSETIFQVRAPSAGQYQIVAGATTAPDYGTVEYSIDGNRIGAPFNGKRDGGVRVERVSLGTATLTAGPHDLKVRITAPAPGDSTYRAGLDYVDLVKVG
ncbi:DUF2961 domain-containing protein [Nakamurella aerolata]|uniref:DUF2961 domain-containing protein n=1 Tax=Nakamurella aerolata TaxID=1656892 RepID=UPI001BB28C80